MATTGHAPSPLYIAPRARRASGTRLDPELARVSTLARVLDRYMVDPIVGLFLPGAGDLLGSLLGVYTVIIAARRRMSPIIIARMLLNLAIDALFGIIPFVGDLFDLGFKAHERNVRLLAERSALGGKATAKDWLAVVGALLVFIATIGLAIYAAVVFGLAIGLAIYTVVRLVSAVGSWL